MLGRASVWVLPSWIYRFVAFFHVKGQIFPSTLDLQGYRSTNQISTVARKSKNCGLNRGLLIPTLSPATPSTACFPPLPARPTHTLNQLNQVCLANQDRRLLGRFDTPDLPDLAAEPMTRTGQLHDTSKTFLFQVRIKLYLDCTGVPSKVYVDNENFTDTLNKSAFFVDWSTCITITRIQFI